MVLFAGVVAAGLVGLVGGKFASRRMLKPLTDVTSVAAAIAHGDLSARLRADTDPDLGSLARSFNRTAAALERRVHADNRFAGDVSHELRTPLTTMINSIVLLQNRRAELPADVVEPLDLLTEDLQRFRRLVVDLLDISRSDGGHDSPEPVVVADLVRRAADAAAGRPVTVVEPGAEAAVLRADKRRLERVVANLVENADVHGGGCDGVCVSRRNGSVRVQVDDHGRGVAEEHRERIFERFARDEVESWARRGPGARDRRAARSLARGRGVGRGPARRWRQVRRGASDPALSLAECIPERPAVGHELPVATTAAVVAAMTAAIISSIALRTASEPQFPSAMALALAFISGLVIPTSSGSTTF